MKIGVLLCGHPADPIKDRHGDFHAMFSRLLDGHGLALTKYDVEAMEFPGSVTDADGWLLTGSKHGVYDDLPFIPVLEDFIRDARAAKVPMVGICFGHQIIAQALGGRAEKFAGGWAIGRQEYQSEDGTLALNAWHQDQVTRPPEGAVTIASSDFCAHAALVYPDGIWTIQPHPEFDNPLIREYLEVRGRDAGVPEKQLQETLSRPDLPIHNAQIASQIAAHFKAYAKEAVHA